MAIQHINFNEIPTRELMEHLCIRYNKFTRLKLQISLEQLQRLKEDKDEKKECTFGLLSLIQELHQKLEHHFSKEEHSIFPYANKLLDWIQLNHYHNIPRLKLMSEPINTIREEHLEIHALLNIVRKKTQFYLAPDDCGPRRKLLYAQLFDMDCDIVNQIYIENNFLFPRLKSLENEIQKIKDLK